MTAVAAKPAQMPWWVVLLEGIAAIILGGLMWMNPLQTANALVFFIAIYWLVSGVISIVRIFFDRRRWGWNLFMHEEEFGQVVLTNIVTLLLELVRS